MHKQFTSTCECGWCMYGNYPGNSIKYASNRHLSEIRCATWQRLHQPSHFFEHSSRFGACIYKSTAAFLWQGLDEGASAEHRAPLAICCCIIHRELWAGSKGKLGARGHLKVRAPVKCAVINATPWAYLSANDSLSVSLIYIYVRGCALSHKQKKNTCGAIDKNEIFDSDAIQLKANVRPMDPMELTGTRISNAYQWAAGVLLCVFFY